MKYIHVNCLKPWLNQHISARTQPNATTLAWQSLSCEVCNSPYPFAVDLNGSFHCLVDCSPPPVPYAVFEIFPKENSVSRGLCVVTFANKTSLKLGRNPDNDIHLSGVSVSRYQATFNWRLGELYVEDEGSRFGTSVLMREPCTVEEGKTLMVQCGKTVLEFGAKYLLGKRSETEECVSEESIKAVTSQHLPEEGQHPVLVVGKECMREWEGKIKKAKHDGKKKMHTRVYEKKFVDCLKGDEGEVYDRDCQ
eukprot:TRINITY_DN5857_c0_g1_i15.p1 TRINITY_DN5857_c0_g1~~TRINITY_DN5857_c0_g1_i15.p1  ORF type:complete len:251 (-),score=31.56 TRINITY_DN5857_c0_g1_i15:135-887(-)